MIRKIIHALWEQTLRAKRDLSEEDFLFPAFHSTVREGIVAKRYGWPYPHVIVDDFLKPEVANAASEYFNELVRDKERRFVKLELYDLFARDVGWREHPSLDFLFDLRFKALIETLFGQVLTEHVLAAMHNNTPRSSEKYIHTDFSPVFFMPHAPCGRLINTTPAHLPTNLLQETPAPQGSVIERRASTAILYLSTDWVPGKGGETGIFARIDNTHVCATKIEPRFNRLLIFENTPYSLHNYMASSLPNRNSIIEWFHVPEPEDGTLPAV